jgi:glyoxylase-like metal-dependent hydrolase (beta-lactamase superfamily II)
MSNSVASGSVAARPALSYPVGRIPAPGEAIEVASGVRWMRMPLPSSLDHINVWAIDDGDGCALVDTGIRSSATMDAWRQLLRSGPAPWRPTRVLVTHMHYDHVGMAGWLVREFSVQLWMTRLEYLYCRVLVSDTGREAPDDATAFYHRAGWGHEAIGGYRVLFGKFGQHIHPLPDSYRRLQDGEEIRIGRHMWRVIVGAGHSPEHACFYCPELRLLISGDQVLPRISSNVSVYPMEPDADPMAQWLDSLDKLQRDVPGDVLVLPAHNECFRGLHARIDALRAGQARAFDRLRRSLREQPRRAIDVFPALFGRGIGQHELSQLVMATGESVACLNHLVRRSEAAYSVDESGVAWYRCA